MQTSAPSSRAGVLHGSNEWAIARARPVTVILLMPRRPYTYWMLTRAVLATLILAFPVFAQTTSTMCQTVPVTVMNGIEDQRLIGCGVGFPDNKLWHLDRSDTVDGMLDQKVRVRLSGRGAVV